MAKYIALSSSFPAALNSQASPPGAYWNALQPLQPRDAKAGKPEMKTTENCQILHHWSNCLVRRQRLAPGEVTPWHLDPFHRVIVVLSGDLVNVESREGGEAELWKITAGEVHWVEPNDRIHRAVNVGKETFEEVVTFFLDRPDAVPQPEEHSKQPRRVRSRLNGSAATRVKVPRPAAEVAARVRIASGCAYLG